MVTGSAFAKRQVQTVSLVGNGPVRSDVAHLVDGSDLVIRFNRAESAGAAGHRTDILCIQPGLWYFADAGRPIARHAARHAQEVWMPDFGKGYRERSVVGRPVLLMPIEITRFTQDLLSSLGASPTCTPSTGALTLCSVRKLWPEARVHMFGFTFQGKSLHPWAAERALAEQMEGEGHVVLHAGSGSPVYPPIFQRLEQQWRRLQGHARAWRF